MLDNLKKGMQLLVTFVGLFVTLYATLFIGLLLIGVIVNIVAQGDINVSGTYANSTGGGQEGIGGAIYNTEQDMQSTVDTLTNPITVLVSLIVVGVLTAFINFRGMGAKQGVA